MRSRPYCLTGSPSGRPEISSSTRARSWYAKWGAAGPTRASMSSLVGFGIGRKPNPGLAGGRGDVDARFERRERDVEGAALGCRLVLAVERHERAVEECGDGDRGGGRRAARIHDDHVHGAVVVAGAHLHR